MRALHISTGSAGSAVARRGGTLAVAVALVATALLAAAPATYARAVVEVPLPGEAVNRVIVNWSVGGPSRVADRVARLSDAAGAAVTLAARVDDLTDAYAVATPVTGDAATALMDRLAGASGAVRISVDHKAYATFTPNDPYYGQQWDFSGTYGIRAPGAWDLTTGSPSVVVAVIDTGITDHSEFAGRTVAGYDMVSDPIVANDGDGRDPDPHDPGDWISAADQQNYPGLFPPDQCPVEPSSWHGTHVAGTIGATGNNGSGIAGLNWTSKIQPVRVLGKCFGYNSDILAAIRWAAGLFVPGVPANPTPARVENLSLGGPGPCTTDFQAAINAATSAGTLVVVAAGNSASNAANFNPANCANVVTVAATNIAGRRASYSNYGSVVDIAAPGGDGSAGILSTWNNGSTTPGAETYAWMMGTSMATPHVAGVAALLFARNPSLTPAQATAILMQTAMPFGADPSPLSCQNVGCGAGIVNAAAAVAAATSPPPSPSPSPSPSSSVAPSPTPQACTPAAPVVTIVPTSLSVPIGGWSTASVSVGNADSGGSCPTSTYYLTVTGVGSYYLSAYLDNAVLSIAPGSTGSATLNVTASWYSSPGQSTSFTVAATRYSSPSTGSATVTATAGGSTPTPTSSVGPSPTPTPSSGPTPTPSVAPTPTPGGSGPVISSATASAIRSGPTAYTYLVVTSVIPGAAPLATLTIRSGATQLWAGAYSSTVMFTSTVRATTLTIVVRDRNGVAATATIAPTFS